MKPFLQHTKILTNLTVRSLATYRTMTTVSSNNHIFQAQNLYNLKNWVGVVTGGGTGIGLMCAQALANNGARVYIVGRRKEALDQAVKVHGSNIYNGGQLIALPGDTSKKETIAELAKELMQREKYVNVLVNNAGISGATTQSVEKGDEGPQALKDELWKVEQSEWIDTYNTNVVGHYYTSVALLPLLAAATAQFPGHSASVINNSSISGITNTSQHHFQYNVSKAAAIQLTTLLAQEFSRKGVKVRANSFAPGVFPTEMTTGESGEDQKSFISAEGFREKKGVPAGRPGKDDDIAQVVLTLAVDTYVNGQTIAVDGGYLLSHP